MCVTNTAFSTKLTYKKEEKKPRSQQADRLSPNSEISSQELRIECTVLPTHKHRAGSVRCSLWINEGDGNMLQTSTERTMKTVLNSALRQPTLDR